VVEVCVRERNGDAGQNVVGGVADQVLAHHAVDDGPAEGGATMGEGAGEQAPEMLAAGGEDSNVECGAKKGGEIGYVSRGELPKMFEDEIFALKPGGISSVIRTDSSFHIFKVDERRAPGIINVQTATPVIRERLKDEEVKSRIVELVGKSRKEMQIAVLTKRLPFRYSGALPKSENE